LLLLLLVLLFLFRFGANCDATALIRTRDEYVDLLGIHASVLDDGGDTGTSSSIEKSPELARNVNTARRLCSALGYDGQDLATGLIDGVGITREYD
jgi:hypothetical protein